MKNLLLLKPLAVLYFLLLAAGSYAQQAIPVSPGHYLQNKRGGIAPLPLFLPGKDNSLLPPGQKHPKLKLPASTGQCGFTFSNCVTPPGYAFDQKTPLYFTNVGTPAMRVYADRNFNFDYTDDGAPVAPDASGMATVFIAPPKDPKAETGSTFILLSKRIDTGKFPAGVFKNNPYYEGLELLDISCWMAGDQLSIKGENIVCEGDSLCVVLLDKNLDGCYSGAEDVIGLDDYGIDSAWTDQYHGVRTIVPGLILPHNGKAYEIIPGSAGCEPIKLKLRSDLAAPEFLKPGDQLPHVYFQFMDNDSTDVYSKMQPGKYTYIEFWGTWCKGCVIGLPDLQNLNAEKKDSLVIISVDAYDNRDKARKFVADKNMTWTQAFSNPVAENILYAGDGFPYGILIDPAGKIMGFDIDTGRVDYYMRQGK